MASGETSNDKSTTEGSPENLCMFYTTRSLDLRKGSARCSWLLYLGRWLRTHTCLCLAIGVLLMHNEVAENSTQLNFAKSQTPWRKLEKWQMELEFFELSLSSSKVLSLADPLLIVSFSQKISVCKASARAIISFFFYSWGFVSTEFSFKLLYYNQRKFLVPLRLGSRFLQVLFWAEAGGCSPSLCCLFMQVSALHCCYFFTGASPPLSWFQNSATMYFSGVHCLSLPVMSSLGNKKIPSCNYFAGAIFHLSAMCDVTKGTRAPARLTTDSLTLPHSNLVFIPLWTIFFC